MDFNLFLMNIRESMTAKQWSDAVYIVRQGLVSFVNQSKDEVSSHVSDPCRAIGYQVKLWIEEEDWLCDCGGQDPCRHIAAAAIALKKIGQQVDLSQNHDYHKDIAYVFKPRNHQLELTRMLYKEGVFSPLPASVLRLSAGNHKDIGIRITKEDTTIDYMLHRAQPKGQLKQHQMPELFKLLEEKHEVFFETKRLQISPEPITPEYYLLSSKKGFYFHQTFSLHPIDYYKNGLAIHDNRLYVLQKPTLLKEEEQILKQNFISLDEKRWLVSSWLPQLQEKLTIYIHTKKLPKSSKISPYVQVEIHEREEEMTILPKIVYGHPPIASITIQGIKFHTQHETPCRNLQEEKALEKKLLKHNLQMGVSQSFSSYQAILGLKQLQKKWPQIFPAEFDCQKLSVLPPLEARINFRDDGFDVRFESSNNNKIYSVSFQQALASWRKKESLVPLLEGGWAPTPESWMRDHADKTLSLLLVAQETNFHVLKPSLVNFAEELGASCPQSWIDLRNRLLSASEKLQPLRHPPLSLQKYLRSYQQEGFKWLSTCQAWGIGALLADDMGLGKTLQVLSVISSKTLVAVPTSVLPHWQKEIARFRPDLTVCLYYGSDRQLPEDVSGVVLTTHSILRLDIQIFNLNYWETLVLDEAHVIKNPRSKIHQAVCSIQAKFRIAMSGTPIENRLEELWSLFQFLNPGLLGSNKKFNEKYENPISSEGQKILSGLHRQIKPFIKRRLKKDVAKELPIKTETILFCQLDAREQKIYQNLYETIYQKTLKAFQDGKSVLMILELLLRLRQASCHLGLLPGYETERTNHSAKTQVFLSQIEQVIQEGHKVLVFSQWTSFLDILSGLLEKEGYDILKLDGRTKDRQKVIDAFEQRHSASLLLMSLKAGGVGINLTAADYVFLLDPWWNPAAEQQAIDRAHRIGQKRPVFVQRLITKDSIEERILGLHAHKRFLSQEVIHASKDYHKITPQDLLNLFK